MSNATERVQKMENGDNRQPRRNNNNQAGTPAARGQLILDAEPLEFKSTVDSTLITASQLGTIVNSLFRPVFRDYVGCILNLATLNMPVPNAMGANGFVGGYHQVAYVNVPRFEVELYFQPNAAVGKCAENAYKNIEQIGTQENNKVSMAARILAMNQQNKVGKNLTLTQETKDILSEFFLPQYCENVNVPDPENPKKKISILYPKYEKGLVYEHTDNGGMVPGMLNTIYLKVTNVDVLKILAKVYGTRNELGHQVEYDLRSLNPYASYVSNNDLLLKLDRVDCEEVKQMTQKLGVMQMTPGLPINRG